MLYKEDWQGVEDHLKRRKKEIELDQAMNDLILETIGNKIKSAKNAPLKAKPKGVG